MDSFEEDPQVLCRPLKRRRKRRSGYLPALVTGSLIGVIVGLLLTGGLRLLLRLGTRDEARAPAAPTADVREMGAERGAEISPARTPGGATAHPAGPTPAGMPPPPDDSPAPGPPPSRPTGTSLRDVLGRLAWGAEASGLVGHLGIYLAPAAPGGGVVAEFRSEEDFPAASVIKVPVMLAVEGNWSAHPESRTRAQSQDLERMIRYSDNEATNALVRNLGGFEPVNAAVRQLLENPAPTTKLASYLQGTGKGSSRPKNRACPREIGQMLAIIADRETAGDPAAREMLEVMRRTSPAHRTRIPQGVPRAFRGLVGNKTGTLNSYPVVNDAAIIETPDGNRYVLCIFMERVRARTEAEAFCREVSRTCWLGLAGPGLTTADPHAWPAEPQRRSAARALARREKRRPAPAASAVPQRGEAAIRSPMSAKEGKPWTSAADVLTEETKGSALPAEAKPEAEPGDRPHRK